MDVLKPPLIYIGKKIYRRNPVKQSAEVELEPYREEDEDFQDEMTYNEPYNDEVCQSGFENLEETENGYRLAMPVASAYFKFVIGKKGETKKRIENETCTSIKIPRAGQEGDIVIQGRDKKGVTSAKTRIDILVESGRQKIPFTHFLSLPVQHPEIAENYEIFKTEVLESCTGDRGLDHTIFQRASKLHLTIGILTLACQAEIEQAQAVLQRCQDTLVRPILGSQPLNIQIKGLEYMNDDPDQVDVLYAKIQSTEGSRRLEDLVNGLVEEFVASGLMRREYDRVKLHLTVMNTLMRKDPNGLVAPGGDQRRRAPPRDRESFDASNVLRLFGDFNFGSMMVDSIHLSDKLGVGPDGYYASADRLVLPS